MANNLETVSQPICPHCHTLIINDGITLCKRCYDKDVDQSNLRSEIEDLKWQLEDADSELQEYQSISSHYECAADDLEMEIENVKTEALEIMRQFQYMLNKFVEKVKKL